MIASLASAQSSGMSLEDSVKLANVAAGIVVGKSGTATPSLVELSLSLNAERQIDCRAPDPMQRPGSNAEPQIERRAPD